MLEGPVGRLPELYAFAKPYWDAFELLNPRRPRFVGLGAVIPGGIAVSEIRAVAPLYGFAETDLEFVQIIISLDNEWLAIQASQQKDSQPRARHST